MATINEAFLDLYENKEDDADVTFLVHGHEVKAHKNIITRRSDTLKAMINSDLAPSDGRHRIDDEKIKVEDFEQFLKFLYLDYCDIDFKNIGALFHMSQMYFVPFLKDRCMDFVQHKCYTVDKIIQCCEIGILYEDECPEMLEFCIEELARRRCFGKHQIPVELIERVAKDCPRTDYVTESMLMVEIYEWGKAECIRRNIPVEKEGIKNVLSPIIKYMNLKDLSYHIWADIIYPNELAPLEECNKHFVDFIKSCTYSASVFTPQMLKDGQKPLNERILPLDLAVVVADMLVEVDEIKFFFLFTVKNFVF